MTETIHQEINPEIKQTKKTRNPWKIAGICLLVVNVIGAGFFLYIWLAPAIPYWIAQRQQGEPDILGSDSWGNINQDITKQEDWQQIVADSQFQLGELEMQYGRLNECQDIYYRYPDATYPTIDGSTVMVRMAAEFAWQHLGLDSEGTRALTQFSTTSYALEKLFNRFLIADYVTPHNHVSSGRPLDLYLGTAPSDTELAQAEQNGIIPVMKPVCWDAFVFITHKDNPVDSLTIEQIKAIYSGKITNWKDVGGEDMAIRAFQREPGSGSQTGMEQHVMQGTPMAPVDKIKIAQGMGYLVESVAEYENTSASLGYTYRYYIDTLYKNPDIKTIKVNGIAPSNEHVAGGTYPLSVNYYGIIRQGDEAAPGGKFLDWILSEEGQACVAQAGYIPLR